jgi:nucleoside 2-deoxyribosyltransferase
MIFNDEGGYSRVCERISMAAGDGMIKIYLAGSWKNTWTLLPLQETLQDYGFEVDCFANDKTGRTSFNWNCLNNALGCPNQAESEFKLKEMNARDLLAYPEVQKAFQEDKKWIDWCDVLILTLPSGKSAHLEAGYAKGQGKKLFIYGVLEKGERDVMYGFADGIFEEDYDFPKLITALQDCDKNKGAPS